MATALVHDPDVLLLDEPFNGMDPRQRLQLMDLLHELGRPGPGRPLQLAHPGGGRADRRRHRGHGRRSARRVRRLPGDPPADDRAPAPVHDPVQRRPRARRRAHRGRLDQRRRAAGRRTQRAGLGLRAISRIACRFSPATTACGCSRSRRPTSRWRRSSPTWSPDERHRPAAHLAQPAGPPPRDPADGACRPSSCCWRWPCGWCTARTRRPRSTCSAPSRWASWCR